MALILVMAMIGLYFGYSLLERNISTERNNYRMNINIDGKNIVLVWKIIGQLRN